MKEQIAIQNLLRKKITEAQSKNPSYSLRAFASRLKLSSGALSEILNGKRIISRKLAHKISENLMLDPIEQALVMKEFSKKYEANKKNVTDKKELLALTAQQFRIIADWEHMAIMSLVHLDDFENKPEWIANRLGISLSKASSAIERLTNLGLLELKDNGKLMRTSVSLHTSDDIASISIKKAHEDTMTLATEALHKYSIDERDFSSVTLASSKEKMIEAKKMIRSFLLKLSDFLESGSKEDVYRCSIQLFPMTHKEREK